MNQNKNNCLPCKIFIMCGTCPYSKRCKYIHDPRLKYKYTQNIQIKYKKKSTLIKKNKISDIFYWPYDTVSNITVKNINGIKYYNIKKPLENSYSKHIELYSIWNNFIDICDNKVNHTRDHKINIYTNKSRLPIFLNISI